MKSRSPLAVPCLAIVLGAAVGVLSSGCPAPTCPQCTIKKAQFTIPTAEGAIVDVVMVTNVVFTGHCNGQRDPDGCTLDDDESLGVLPENARQQPNLPFTTDDDDAITVRIEVHRQTPDGTVIQTPAPAVTIVR